MAKGIIKETVVEEVVKVTKKSFLLELSVQEVAMLARILGSTHFAGEDKINVVLQGVYEVLTQSINYGDLSGYNAIKDGRLQSEMDVLMRKAQFKE